MKQQTIAMAADQTFEQLRKPTRRDEFLKTIDAIAPWAVLCESLPPLLQGRQWSSTDWVGTHAAHSLYPALIQPVDLACAEALYDSMSLRSFVGIDQGLAPVPDSTTLLKFHKRLNDNKPSVALLSQIGAVLLQSKDYKVGTGTIANASIIDTLVHQECRQYQRPRDTPNLQGQAVILWDEVAHRRGNPINPCTDVKQKYGGPKM